MGGTDDPSNLIELTVEDHAEAHRKLWEQYGNWQDEIAWKALSGQIKKEDFHNEIRRTRMLGNKIWLGRKHSPESRSKMGPKKGTVFTEEHRKKLSEKRKTRIILDSTKEKLAKPRHNRRKKFEITYPDGKTEIIIGLKEFCKKQGIQMPNMYKVMNGERNDAQGFKCKKVDE